MPKDFIVLHTQLAPEEMTHRYAFARSIDNQVTPELIEDLNYELRACVQRHAECAVDKYFAEKFNKQFPNFTPGKRYNCIAEFLEAHATQPFTNKMAEAVHFVMIGMWGSHNHWARTEEKVLMKVMGIGYSENACN